VHINIIQLLMWAKLQGDDASFSRKKKGSFLTEWQRSKPLPWVMLKAGAILDRASKITRTEKYYKYLLCRSIDSCQLGMELQFVILITDVNILPIRRMVILNQSVNNNYNNTLRSHRMSHFKILSTLLDINRTRVKWATVCRTPYE